MKNKFKFWFLSSTFISIPIITVSCTAEKRTKDSIKDFNDYLNNIEKKNDPRYKYFIPILKYTVGSLNGLIDSVQQRAYYFSESQWNNINAQVAARKVLFQEVENELNKVSEEKINDPSEGIKSNKFLDFYFTLHGLGETKFTSFKDASENLNLTQWWTKYSKAFILNDLLNKTPLALAAGASNELKNLHSTTLNIFKSQDKKKPTKEIVLIDNFVSDYSKEIEKRIKELIEVDDRYFETLNKFNLLNDEFEKNETLIKESFKKYFDLISEVRSSYLETLLIDPILSPVTYDEWGIFFFSFSYRITEILLNIINYKLEENIKYVSELLKSIKDEISENEYNALEDKISKSNNKEENDKVFDEVYQKVLSFIKKDIQINESKEIIKKYLEENKGN
ncbi:hypothetical protein [Mycoplasmopsis edwardii]|uniref:hypothetical protein n=1 Tax=Mycoplasmopsis edwardii TaxID=53558 RepID=UPI0011AB38B4|nr:hypothetical protein [Mycoplasmopsis edwardii]